MEFKPHLISSFTTCLFLLIYTVIGVLFIRAGLSTAPPGMESTAFLLVVAGLVILLFAFWTKKNRLRYIDVRKDEIVVAYFFGNKTTIRTKDVTGFDFGLHKSQKGASLLDRITNAARMWGSWVGLSLVINHKGGAEVVGVVSLKDMRKMLDELEKVTGREIENKDKYNLPG